MTEKLVHEESPVEFFRDQLERAMEHQKVSTSAFTEYYLVNLLAGCIQGESLPSEAGYEEMPLALLYVQALAASRLERIRLLRSMGDTALFISGFFADSVNRKIVDLDYYKSMGGHAYARLSRQAEGTVFGPTVFAELAWRFTEFADLFSEISENSRLTSHASILRLYEKWLQTGSRRAASLLADRGITPVLPGDGTLQ